MCFILRSYRFVEEVTFKLPQNCYLMNINSGFSTHHIYLAWNIILTIWINMKARELQKNFWLIGKNLEVQFKLKLKNLNFQSLPWIEKNWEAQNLTRNWEKCFISRKIEFWTHWKFCTYIPWKLLPEKKCFKLFPNVNNANINSSR